MDYNVRKYQTSGSVSNKQRPGRPKITTPAEDRAMVITSKRNRRKTAPEIAAEMNISRPKPVSVTTVKRRLRQAGLYGRIAMWKPLFSKENLAKRLAWVREHTDWALEDWTKVLWTDESKFLTFGSNKRNLSVDR